MTKQLLITKIEARINNSKQKFPNRNYDNILPYLKSGSFFDDPAAKSYHNNFPGGLAQHVLNFTNTLEVLLESFTNIKLSSDDYDPFLVALGHDLNKVGSYNFSDVNKKVGSNWHNLKGYGYNDKIYLMPSNNISLDRIKSIMILTLSEELSIFWCEGSWSTYNSQQLDKNWKNALSYDGRVYLSHTADMLSSQLIEKTFSDIEVDKAIREWIK